MNDVLAKMAVEISARDAKFKQTLSSSQKTLGTFTKSVGALSNQLKGLVAGFGIYEIGRQIIQTTSEFQKFAAVLKNSLGSDKEAQRSLQQIKDFAAATPFSVQELTGSFVKLVNQGFKPTTGEMRKLGDLAASTGKGFDQLTEAIIDAQVGEFERLKEFGIRASKQGDKVTFTFKGVKTQVDFTSESIQQYILSLGDAAGVSGAMDKISKTLGGRISNLGDAWDNLMNVMGQSSSGPLFAVVESLTNITGALANLGSELALIGQAISPFHDLSDVSKETLDYLLKFARTDTGKRMAEIMEPFTKQSNIEFLKNYDKNFKAFTKTLSKEGESLEDIQVLWEHYAQSRLNAVEADKEAASDKRRSDFQKYIDDLNAQAAAAKKLKDELAALAKWKVGAAAPLRKSVTSKTGADFLFDSGALAEMANAGSNAMQQLNDSLQINSNAWDEWWSGVQARTELAGEAFKKHEEQTQHLAEVAQTVGGALGDVFGSIASGQEELAKTLARVTEQIIEMLLKQSIALMIKSALEDPSVPFPFAKIAIAAAGIGLVKGLFSRIGGSSGGGSAGGSSAPGHTPSEMKVDVGGRIRGYDLAIVRDNEGYRRGRLG